MYTKVCHHSFINSFSVNKDHFGQVLTAAVNSISVTLLMLLQPRYTLLFLLPWNLLILTILIADQEKPPLKFQEFFGSKPIISKKAKVAFK